MKTFHSHLTASAIALLSALGLSPAWAETAQPGTYKIDPDHTSVHFTVGHLGTSELVGRFNQIEGDFTLAPGGESRVEVRIATASVDTNHQKRDDHLRSPDFFNAKQFPEMKFTSRKVRFNDGEPQRIEGELSLHGKTRPVSLNV